MVCAGLETVASTSIVGILAFPTSCDYWFWGKIMFAFWIILTMILYYRDKDSYLKSDMISAMGVSSIATIFASLGLTLLEETLDNGTVLSVMQPDVFVTIFVLGMIFIVLWLLKK